VSEVLYEITNNTVQTREQAMYISGEVRVQGSRYTHHFTCDKGDVVRLYAEFTDINDLPYDPVTLNIYIKRPDGQTDSYSGYGPGPITRVDLGHFYIDTPVLISGTWIYRWEALGTGEVAVAVAERTFNVKRSYLE
jgi:hypothetical protein